MSAQTCSLSENVVEDWRLMSTGRFQLPLFAAMAGVSPVAGASSRDTAIASKPRNASSERVAPRFAVRFA